MLISNELDSKEIIELQQKFYEYFENGYVFEEFLKEYLLKMGLDEVEVTQRSRDGGVDLKAIRKGVGDFSETDITYYHIQAKRYALNNKVSVKAIRELKGTIPFANKGMLITTSNFTNDAIEESCNDPSKLLVLINGKNLVTSCIDNQIGFIYKPIFSHEQMNKILKKEKKVKLENNVSSELKIEYIEKTITSNDVRARIVSVPRTIMNFLSERDQVTVKINGEKYYIFSINKGRNYFAKVSQFFKDYEITSADGVINMKKCRWIYNKQEQVVEITILDDKE